MMLRKKVPGRVCNQRQGEQNQSRVNKANAGCANQRQGEQSQSRVSKASTGCTVHKTNQYRVHKPMQGVQSKQGEQPSLEQLGHSHD